jgi:CheY-like chemotaxis protein
VAEKPVILSVHDNADDALLLDQALRSSGFPGSLATVSSAEEAMSYLEGTGRFGNRFLFPFPGLVLLGSRLRGLNGLELLWWIRRQSALSHLRVVVLSGSELNQDVEAAYTAWANCYLAKPASFNRLVETCRTLVAFWFELDVRAKRGLAK